MNKIITEHIEHLRSLIEVERKEEEKLFREKIIQTPLADRCKKGVSWFPLVITKQKYGTGGNFYLTVERTKFLDTHHPFRVGTNVSLFSYIDEKVFDRLTGVVAKRNKNSVKIAFSNDKIPDWVFEDRLGLDLHFDQVTFREMEFALRKMENSEDDRVISFQEMFLGEKKPHFTVHNRFHPFPYLNDSQNAAINLIDSACDFAIVHGPPGTGKTTTIVSAVKHLLDTEKQILVVAPSNNAVDLLTEKLAEKNIRVVRMGNPARVNEEVLSSCLDSKIAKHSDYNFLKKLRRQSDELRQKALKFKRNFGEKERNERRSLHREATELRENAKSIEKYIIEGVLDDAQVITATLVGANHSMIYKRKFSTVFIDEAAQALEAASWIPILKAQKLVLAGDHFQLPPTVKSREADRKGLGKTLFERLIDLHPNSSKMLDTQYRMNNDIMSYSNQVFYGGLLKADESVKNHQVFYSDGDTFQIPLEYVDTAGCSFEEKRNEDTLSTYNEEEAQLVVTHLNQYLQHLDLNHQDSFTPLLSVAVISPYQAQVNVLRELLEEQLGLAALKVKLDVNTVDGFQGQERDIVYISLVRSNDRREVGFLSDIRRMNVAMTRAKKRLVIFGDSACISSNKFYDNFVSYVEANNSYHTAWEYLY